MAGLSEQLAQLKSKFAGLSSLNLGALGGGGSAVGLSIGTSSIKIVELQKVGKIWKLLHFGMVQLPEDTIVNREIVNAISVVDSIKTLTNQLKLKTKSVCTSLSGSSMMIKRMQVEAPNPKELRDQVFWEAEQYLPFDVSEVVMDFQSLSKAKERTHDVIFVAAKRSTVDSYMGVVTDAGLKPKIVDVDYFALQNLYEANYAANSSEAVAIVEIGAASLKFVVVHAGVPVFTKDASIGGNNLTADIQKTLNLSFSDAEALKTGGHENGLPQEVSELMTAMCENIASEVKKMLELYNASSTGAPVVSVLLAGGGAKLHELSHMVEEFTGLPSQLVNPFNAITYDPAVFTPDYISAIAPIASVPIGLALRAGAP